jgi:hypothetical protein
MGRSIKLSAVSDALKYFGIPNFGQYVCAQIEEDWGHKVSGLVLRYNQNVLRDSIFFTLHNGLFYNHQPFHYPASVECLGLDCTVE